MDKPCNLVPLLWNILEVVISRQQQRQQQPNKEEVDEKEGAASSIKPTKHERYLLSQQMTTVARRVFSFPWLSRLAVASFFCRDVSEFSENNTLGWLMGMIAPYLFTWFAKMFLVPLLVK